MFRRLRHLAPGGEALAAIRTAIADDPRLDRITQANAFRDTFTLRGNP